MGGCFSSLAWDKAAANDHTFNLNIGGANSNLGNPVDIMYSGSDLFVAEKSNNVIMRFDNILASEGGDIAANATISFNAPESVALIPHYISE